MRTQRAWIVFVIAALPLLARAEEVFQLSFRGSARFLNDRGRVQTRRMTTDDLIARCVGEAGLGTNNHGTNRQFELIYNPAADTVQVLDLTNRSFMCDVLQFGGGVSNIDHHQLSRLAFVFTPEQTQAVGSAVLTEHIRNQTEVRSLHAQAQFALDSLEPGSSAGATFNPFVETNSPGSGSTTDSGTPGTNSGSVGTNVTGLVPTNALPITSPAGPVAPPVDTNSTLMVTNNLSGAGNAGITNSLILFPPTLPGASSTVNAGLTNAVAGAPANTSVTIGATSNNSPLTPISPPVIATNSLPGVNPIATPPVEATAGVTNEMPGLSISNGVICSGNFSTGRRISLTSGP